MKIDFAVLALTVVQLLSIHSAAAVDITVKSVGYISGMSRPMAIVTVGDVKTSFLVDTGSPRSAIDVALAKAVDRSIRPLRQPKLRAQLKVARVEAKDLELITIDLSNARIASMDSFFGILGMDVLDGLQLYFDFDNNKVILGDSTIPPASAETQEIRRDSLSCPECTLTVGLQASTVLLDTGADFAVRLDADAYSELIKASRIRSRVRPTGVLGADSFEALEEYCVAPVRMLFDDPSDTMISQASKGGMTNAVGTLYLRKYNTFIDLKENRMTCWPSKYCHQEECGDSFGIICDTSFTPCLIAHIMAESVADRANLLPGDEILSVVTRDGSAVTVKEVVMCLRCPPPGRIVVRVRRSADELERVIRDGGKVSRTN